MVSADKARQIFKDQPYKLELIDGLEKGGLDEYGNPLDETRHFSSTSTTPLPVPWAACRAHRRDPSQGFQTAHCSRRVLARRRAQPHAAAHLRNGGRVPGGAGSRTKAHRGGQETRSPASGARTGPLQHQRGCRRRADLVAPERWHGAQAGRRLLPRGA